MGELESSRRVVHCGDALAWLGERPVLEGCSIVTSLPDVSELSGMSLAAWREWFVAAARLVLSRVPAEGAALFYQTDVKREAGWTDKSHLVQRAADEEGVPLLFHKIVCRKPPGTTTFGRAGYAHLLCFSRGATAALSRSTADVIADGGAMTWVRAIGIAACRIACAWVRDATSSRTVVDPFCGVGTVLAVANELGLDAVGVELNRKRAARARRLEV